MGSLNRLLWITLAIVVWGAAAAQSDLAAVARSGSVAAVGAALAAGADVHARTPDGTTPLLIAAWRNPHPGVFRLLLEAGADVDDVSAEGRSPLMLAAAFNDVGVVRYLLDVVADVDARDDQGVTLLMLAAGSNESAEPVHLLLDRGADGALRDARGKTAFDDYRENSYATDRDAFDRLHAAQGR